MVLGKLFIAYTLVLLFNLGKIGAVEGPETPASLSDYPYLVNVDHSVFEYFLVVPLVSSKYVVGPPNFFDESYLSALTVYSGDITSKDKAKKHTITRLYNNGKVAILKLCPGARNFKAMTLTPNKMYDFSSNKTGKSLYLRRSTWELFYRTSPVLTDADCEADDNQGLPGQRSNGYQAPEMACSQYDPTEGSCAHFKENGVWSTMPLLLVDDQPVATHRNADCSSSTMYGQIGYWKIVTSRDYIAENAVVDIP